MSTLLLAVGIALVVVVAAVVAGMLLLFRSAPRCPRCAACDGRLDGHGCDHG